MLKPLLLLLSFEKKKIHSVSGCHDWILLGAPNFIMHSQYISLMYLTCGKIDRFSSSFHAIRLQRLCKLSKTFYHISYLSSSSPGVICLVKLIAYILPPFFFATNHENKSCGQVCLLSPFRRGLGVFASCRIPWCKPTALDQLVEEDPVDETVLCTKCHWTLLKFDLLQYFVITSEVT